jgi:hypothetical protein
MPPRQVWLFQLGCWVACATAAVHLAGHVFVPGTAGPSELAGPAPAYLFLIPGQDVPSARQVADGFSLALALLLATLGAAGLAVLSRGHADATLMRGIARVYALGIGVILALSILSFFSLQTFFLAVAALCFGLAAVSEE